MAEQAKQITPKDPQAAKATTEDEREADERKAEVGRQSARRTNNWRI